MKLKTALIASGIWTAVGVIGCVVLISVIASKRLSQREAEQRAPQAGTGAAAVMGIGYAAIWLPFAGAVGKRRREALRKGSKRRPRDRDDAE